MKKLPETLNLQAVMHSDDGLRVLVHRGMRAPIVNGELTLQPVWRAECEQRVGKRWVLLITIVEDSLPQLFQTLAALSAEGEVRIGE